jgi:hypothetical protein
VAHGGRFRPAVGHGRALKGSSRRFRVFLGHVACAGFRISGLRELNVRSSLTSGALRVRIAPGPHGDRPSCARRSGGYTTGARFCVLATKRKNCKCAVSWSVTALPGTARCTWPGPCPRRARSSRDLTRVACAPQSPVARSRFGAVAQNLTPSRHTPTTRQILRIQRGECGRCLARARCC